MEEGDQSVLGRRGRVRSHRNGLAAIGCNGVDCEWHGIRAVQPVGQIEKVKLHPELGGAGLQRRKALGALSD